MNMTQIASALHGQRVEYEISQGTLYLLSNHFAMKLPDRPLPKALQKIAVPAQHSSPALRLAEISKTLVDVAEDTGMTFKPSASRPAVRILTATKHDSGEKYAVYVEQRYFALVEEDILCIITSGQTGTVEFVTGNGFVYIQPHQLHETEIKSFRERCAQILEATCPQAKTMGESEAANARIERRISMNKEVCMNTTTKDHIHCDDTVFAIETNSDGIRQVHIYGYGYFADSSHVEGKDYRFVEYTFCYVPLDEVLQKGLGAAEDKYGLEVKQYITDCTYDEMMHIYQHYDNGKCPIPITAFDANTPDGTYVLVSE